MPSEPKSAWQPKQPMSEAELAAAQRLGEAMRFFREDAGKSVAQVARDCELSRDHIRRLELGKVRTRASTLRRIAWALFPPGLVEDGKEVPTEKQLNEMHNELVAYAGEALAPESLYADRIGRRRARRQRALEREDQRRKATEAMRLAASRARVREQMIALGFDPDE